MSGSHIRVTGYFVPWWMALAGWMLKMFGYFFLYVCLPALALGWPLVALQHTPTLSVVVEVVWLGLLGAGGVFAYKVHKFSKEQESAMLRGAGDPLSSDSAGEPHQAGR